MGAGTDDYILEMYLSRITDAYVIIIIIVQTG